MVGVTEGQSALLSVTVPPDPIIPNDPVRVLLGFVKSNGEPVLNADGFPMQMEAMVRPGESAFFDLPAHFILTGDETRAEIRPVVKPEGPPVRIIPILEVIENCSTCTGKTTVLYAPVTCACGASQ